MQQFINQFHDTASFYSITYDHQNGQEKKDEELLYDSIDCNLVERESPFKLESTVSQDEYYTNRWRCDVSSSYGGAKRGDRVKITKDSETRDFTIVKKVVDTDFNSTIQFYKYYLIEKQ